MIKDDGVYMRHILQCIADITRYVGGDKAKFMRDDLVRNATLRLSVAIKACMPSVPWNDIAGFRNIMVHDYLGDIDLERVWQVIEARLPELQSAITPVLKNKG